MADAPPTLSLHHDSWRKDLLRIVLRVAAILGGIVYLPSVYFALKLGMAGVAAMDTVAMAAVAALAYFERIPTRVRAAAACAVFYVLGAGLMSGVGSISQIYLFGFSLLTTLMVSNRWGLATVAVNCVTMLVIGYVGIAAPEMVVPRWGTDVVSWSVISANFVFVNAGLVLALGAVIDALEHEQRTLVTLNRSLAQEVADRTRSEQALRENKALLRIAGRTARLGGWRVELGGDRVGWSDEVCELHEVAPGTAPTLAEASAFYTADCRAAIEHAVGRCAVDGTPFDVEAEIITAGQVRLWVRSIGHALRDASGTITHVHGSIQDITPQKHADARHDKLEEQFRQAQKMETIGNLAAGVAHDFNNLLSVVLSYSQMLAEDLTEGDPMRTDLREIENAGLRAVDLTRQLLAFSRQQVLAPEIVDLAPVIAGMEKMLRRLIAEDVELAIACPPGAGNVLVDPGQLAQVVMNLVVNARDAMPTGGALTIRTSEVTLDASYADDHVGVTPGRHVMLSVSDTGTGMDKAVQARMFEPFFTTKEKGKGTGLGLATVFGIVQQSGGTIRVDSELGHGATFYIYLPVAQGATTEAVGPHARGTTRGSETILLVEDEEGVRMLTRTILRKQGYTVLEAQNGGAAFLLCEQHAAPIHLLLTDVVMPRMSGRELAERLAPIRPEMKVLYMSGYTDDTVVRHGVFEATIALIQKPVTPGPLARKVREVLDR